MSCPLASADGLFQLPVCRVSSRVLMCLQRARKLSPDVLTRTPATISLAAAACAVRVVILKKQAHPAAASVQSAGRARMTVCCAFAVWATVCMALIMKGERRRAKSPKWGAGSRFRLTSAARRPTLEQISLWLHPLSIHGAQIGRDQTVVLVGSLATLGRKACSTKEIPREIRIPRYNGCALKSQPNPANVTTTPTK